MIATKDLRAIARARLKDAEILLEAKRFDAASYMCGYAVEIALKARMCQTLKWAGFPESAQDFRGLQSIRTHDLAVLLKLSGREAQVKTMHMTEWAFLVDWNPEMRYQAVGRATKQQAVNMVTNAKRLLGVL